MKIGFKRLLFLLVIIISGCYTPDKPTFKLIWDAGLYKPEYYKTSCEKLILEKEGTVDLNAYSNSSDYILGEPVFRFCNDNKKFTELFGPNSRDSYPFYLGRITGFGKGNMGLFVFKNSIEPGAYRRGYIFYPYKDGLAMFPCYDSTKSTEGIMTEVYVHDRYMLLLKTDNPKYDMIDDRSWEITETYCVLEYTGSEMTMVPKSLAGKLVLSGKFNEVIKKFESGW